MIDDVQTTREAIDAQVRRIIAEALERPAAGICADHELEADLGVDSLAMTRIGVELEHALGFLTPDVADPAAHPLPVTVAELVDLVHGDVALR